MPYPINLGATPIAVSIALNSTDIYNLSTPLTILASPGAGKFLSIDRLLWKLKFNSVAYEYVGEIHFKIGVERIATLQADNLTSSVSCAAVSNANLCQDLKCPFVSFNTGLTVELTGTAPVVGDSTVYIDIYYFVEEIPEG